MAKMTKAKRAAAARKGWRKRRGGKAAPKKSSMRKSSSKKAMGKVVARPTFGTKKFACHGKRIKKSPRVFCRRQAK